MLETILAYAALELTASGERDDAVEGLVLHSSSEAFLAAKGPGWTVAVAWLDRVREDLESYRGALACSSSATVALKPRTSRGGCGTLG